MTGRLVYHTCTLCSTKGEFRNPECRKCRAALNQGRQEKHKLLQRRLRLTQAVNRILQRFYVDDLGDQQVVKNILEKGIIKACQPQTWHSNNATKPTVVNATRTDDFR